MLKTLVVLLTLCAMMSFAQAFYKVEFWNYKGTSAILAHFDGKRECFCVKNTQTARIYNRDGGDVKLFSTSDCTGNFVRLDITETQKNTEWVNSFSMGKANIASIGPKSCPDYFA
ncbi:hypothetical protein F5H01DRAFT_358962 [Linnemannia elongata]|nr:hypothetical protein F5H01DRAFT_358962 [Linnemannia elongata]